VPADGNEGRVREASRRHDRRSWAVDRGVAGGVARRHRRRRRRPARRRQVRRFTFLPSFT